MRSNLVFSVVRDPFDFSKLKGEWGNLLENSDSNNIYLTWEWLHTWWAIFGKNCELALIEVREKGGNLIGIAPFKFSRRRVFAGKRKMEFIGNGSDITSEYLDIIVRRGYESAVREGLAKVLDALDEIATISLKPLVHNNDLQNWAGEGWAFQKTSPYSTCPVFDLPPTWERFLATKSKNFRKKAKEYHRVCRRDLQLRLIRVEAAEELPARMNDLERLHKLRWQGRPASFSSNAYRQFHLDISRQFLARGWLRLFFLYDGDRPIGALYCYAYNNVYYYCQAGRDPAYNKYHLGYVMINLAIQEAIKEGARSFDMLTGEEAYKYHWANSRKTSVHLLACKNSFAYWRYNVEYLIDRLSYQHHKFRHRWRRISSHSKENPFEF
jgi:CelD/BcsL family acetyltransferase involved in cellulose biosynthesis